MKTSDFHSAVEERIKLFRLKTCFEDILNMEIKIKDQNGYIEADWTVENGVMIVSPKTEKTEKIDLSQFKDGDILYCSWGGDSTAWVAILKGEVEYMNNTNVFMEDYCSLFLTGDKQLEVEGYSDSATFVRHATEEERNKLFQALADNGLEWDVKERKLVKVKWKPERTEYYYSPFCRCVFFEPCEFQWGNTDFSNSRYHKGWVFKTEQECQEFCDRLNQAIENIKP